MTAGASLQACSHLVGYGVLSLGIRTGRFWDDWAVPGDRYAKQRRRLAPFAGWTRRVSIPGAPRATSPLAQPWLLLSGLRAPASAPTRAAASLLACSPAAPVAQERRPLLPVAAAGLQIKHPAPCWLPTHPSRGSPLASVGAGTSSHIHRLPACDPRSSVFEPRRTQFI